MAADAFRPAPDEALRAGGAAMQPVPALVKNVQALRPHSAEQFPQL